MTLSFGIDMSSWQYSADGTQKPDFDKVNSTCDFVAVRAGISWGYTDKWFSYSWGHLTVPRLAYHVVYPGESAIRQMEHFLRIVNPGEHDRLVLDMELDHGYSKARITQTLYECLDFLVKETGRYPIVYSRASWINQFVDTSQIPSEDWWLAGYRYPLPSPQYTPEMTTAPCPAKRRKQLAYPPDWRKGQRERSRRCKPLRGHEQMEWHKGADVSLLRARRWLRTVAA